MAVVLGTLAGPGDVVLTEALTYPGVKAIADLFRFELVGLAMDSQGILPDAFEKACRGGRTKALFCMPSLQNPTGAHMPVERRREIESRGLCAGMAPAAVIADTTQTRRWINGPTIFENGNASVATSMSISTTTRRARRRKMRCGSRNF